MDESAQKRKASEEELKARIKELEDRLTQQSQEKDKLLKTEMGKIQQNLEVLKDQISSTNHSMIND